MKQLWLFPEEKPVYRPMPEDASPREVIQAINQFNQTGDKEALFSTWGAVTVASRKIVNKRLGGLRIKDRENLVYEVVMLFFERISRRKAKGKPYQIKKLYAVLFDLSTWILYQEKQKQHDRELYLEEIE